LFIFGTIYKYTTERENKTRDTYEPASITQLGRFIDPFTIVAHVNIFYLPGLQPNR